MKKIVYSLFIIYTLLFCSLSVAAKDYDYSKIDDSTTIEEDFKLLGIDINSYYKPSYDYAKWYVVAMSECYLEELDYIQTYFYIYNPTRYGGEDYMSTPANFTLSYRLNLGPEKNDASGVKLDYNEEHLIYKVKGFTYDYIAEAEIFLTKVQHYNLSGGGITSDSGFSAKVNHSKINGFNVELNFNSTLILEEYIIKSITIPKESNFWKDLGTLLTLGYGDNKRTNLVFYNFNFPKTIRPDEILKAVFNYDLVSYRGVVNHDEPGGAWATIGGDEYAREEIRPKQNSKGDYNDEDLGVYVPGTHTYKASNFSTELNFETFVLGNRVTKGEFGYVDMSSLKEDFDYDCSILLGNTTIECSHPNIGGSGKTFQKFENVEFIELHYKKDGIVYRCQIVSKPIDEPPSDTPPAKESLWDKFLKWFIENFPLSALIVLGIPIVIIVLAIFCPWILSLIIKGVVTAIQFLIQFIVKLIRAIFSILTFPIRLIIRIVKRK